MSSVPNVPAAFPQRQGTRLAQRSHRSLLLWEGTVGPVSCPTPPGPHSTPRLVELKGKSTMTESAKPAPIAAQADAAREACNSIVEQAAAAMLKVPGASVSMILDRLLTFVGAQAVGRDGSLRTGEHFRDLADKIDHGLFMHLEPASDRKPQKAAAAPPGQLDVSVEAILAGAAKAYSMPTPAGRDATRAAFCDVVLRRGLHVMCTTGGASVDEAIVATARYLTSIVTTCRGGEGAAALFRDMAVKAAQVTGGDRGTTRD